MHPELSFDQAPPISVPYRFFLTAPWFGVAAGLLLVVYGKSALVTRWAPETLAFAHLMTAGFMLQAMCGALLQFVPVAAGGNVAHPARLAAWVHPMLIGGTLLLVTGFLSGTAAAFLLALPLFAAGGMFFVGALMAAMRRIAAPSPTLAALKLAAISLALTLGLGIVLAAALGQGWSFPLLELTDAHVAFGLGGWGLILLIGVSMYVVPMFQLTPPYPSWLGRYLPTAIFALALLSLVPLVVPADWLAHLISIGLLALAAIYAVTTIRVQMRRRRRQTDPGFWFFRGGMLATCLAVLCGAVRAWWAPAELEAPLLLSAGILLLGAFASVISGMLYKIVPFINWLHLQRLSQRLAGLGSMPPNMRMMIPELQMRRQMILHFAALAILLLAVWWPILSWFAGLLWAASFAWLGVNLLGGVKRYAEFRDQIRAGASRHES